jgi:hypothetical protein
MDNIGNALVIFEQWPDPNENVPAGIYAIRSSASGVWDASKMLQSGGSNPTMAMDDYGNAVVAWENGGDIFALKFFPSAWGTAKLLEYVTGYGSKPQVAMDSSGNGIVVWQQYDGAHDSIYARRYVAGAWGPVTLLEYGTGTAWSPQVAMDSSGNAVVVWQQYDSASHLSLYSKRLTSGVWGSVTLLEYATGDAWSPQVAMDNHGNAVVAWTQYDSSSHLNLYAKRLSSGVWGPVTLLEYGAGGVWGPQVAMDSSGNTVVVWCQLDSSYHLSIFAKRYSSRAWGPVTLLEAGTGDAKSPQVAMDNHGNAIAVWKQTDGNFEHIYSKRFSAGVWGSVISIGKDMAVYDPQVAMDDKGNALVVWSDWYGSMSGSQQIYMNRFSAGVWGAATPTTAVTWSSVSPQIAMNNDGEVMVVLEGVDYITGDTHIYADRYSSIAWGPVTLLEAGTGDAKSPQVAMDNHGDTMVVWQQYDGAHESIYANMYDADA